MMHRLLYPDIPLGQFFWFKRHDPKHGWLPRWSAELHVGDECIGDRKLYGLTVRMGMLEVRFTLFRPFLDS